MKNKPLIQFIFCTIFIFSSHTIESKILKKKFENNSDKKLVNQKNSKSSILPKKVHNKITKDDLGYYKMFSWHYPETFTLKVNGTELQSGENIEINEKTLTVQYTYKWETPWGKQAGAKEIIYELADNVNQVDITFDGWEQEQKISIVHAKRVTQETSINS